MTRMQWLWPVGPLWGRCIVHALRAAFCHVRLQGRPSASPMAPGGPAPTARINRDHLGRMARSGAATK